MLWLLLGEQLSPHEHDQIGNTVLHQAAAGGHLEARAATAPPRAKFQKVVFDLVWRKNISFKIMMASRNKHNFDTVSQSSFDWICLRARQRGRGVPAGAGCGRPRQERPRSFFLLCFFMLLPRSFLFLPTAPVPPFFVSALFSCFAFRFAARERR